MPRFSSEPQDGTSPDAESRLPAPRFDESFDAHFDDAHFDDARPASRARRSVSPRSSAPRTASPRRDATRRHSVPRDTSRGETTRHEATLRDAARRAGARQAGAAAFEEQFDEFLPDEAPRQIAPRAKSEGEPRARRKSEDGAKNGGAKRKKEMPPRTPPRALVYEISGVLLLALGALLLWNARLPVDAIRGVLPRVAVGALRFSVGIGAYVVPALMCVFGAILIVHRHRTNVRAFGRGAATGLLVLLTATHLSVPHGHEFDERSILYAHGGYLGAILSWILRSAVGEIGAVIALVALSLVTLLLWSEVSLGEIVHRAAGFAGAGALNAGRRARSAGRNAREGIRTYYGDFGEYEEADDQKILPPEIVRDALAIRPPRARQPVEINRVSLAGLEDLLPEPPRFIRKSTPEFGRTFDGEASADGTPANETSVTEVAPETLDPHAPRIEFTDAPPPEPVVAQTPLEVVSDEAKTDLTPNEALEAQALASATEGTVPKKIRPEVVRRRFGEGPLMPPYFDDAVRALDPPLIPDLSGTDEDIHHDVAAVQETLASFKIDARVTDVKRGPVITRYEVQPAPGVRVASIANLDRDMARSLSAIAVRIEAPVPGKNVVGIEVPNKKVHLVRLRDVLERHEFLSAPSKLSFVLGKDIAGQPKWADLTKMPHMLIAGSTNSGKSVCLNSIIASILVRATPEEVKFSLIDPKRVELTLFKDIRHLYHPVVVEPKDAVKALRGMIAEMDRRYKRFAERGVRNIASFNSKLEEGEAPLPYIVIVIDELADLMMTAAAEFEKLICRLAQLARATGIHLIVATQRPSVNVITGVIKANIPSRIAFAVASQVDSRTILDCVGAERLIGSGDMLYDANNGGKPVRIQGAYLSEEEVNRIVDVIKACYAEDDEPFEYQMDISAVDEDDVNEANERTAAREEKRDEMYDEILEYVVRCEEMSASMIQRKFEIGYPRAARIVDQFEHNGVLSPANGPKARKVIGNGRGQTIE